MLSLFQNAVYLSGMLTVIVMLFLPAVFLLVISTIYIVVEAVCRYWEGRGSA